MKHHKSVQPAVNSIRPHAPHPASIAQWAAAVVLTAGGAAHAGGAPLTPDQARAIVAPLYDALNEPSTKDVAALLRQATTANYRSCANNQVCLNRDQLAEQFTAFGAIIPDLHWTIKDILTSGDHIIVRGEATGTPVAPLFGVPPSGQAFRTMSLDLFTVTDGKLSSAYHVENWTDAISQIQLH